MNTGRHRGFPRSSVKCACLPPPSRRWPGKLPSPYYPAADQFGTSSLLGLYATPSPFARLRPSPLLPGLGALAAEGGCTRLLACLPQASAQVPVIGECRHVLRRLTVHKVPVPPHAGQRCRS